MAKSITNFVCQECGYDSPAYLGKCPECGNWNTFKEFHVQKTDIRGRKSDIGRQNTEIPKPISISDVKLTSKNRMQTGFAEMDSVLGGGIVLGSAILVAGDPGIGKSTLLLQLCLNLAISGKKVLYVSAEESQDQVAGRAERLTQKHQNIQQLFLLSLTDTDRIAETIENMKPDLVIVDSIQTVESENGGGLSGSVSQVRFATTQFTRLAKQNNIPVILVGHVTKEGMVAGPMMLSHMVDTVLFLEGERFTKTRILRSFKNRFGTVDEVGVFLMEEKGMMEVKNPEQIFLSEKHENVPGSVMAVVMEGTRPFLVEIQALVVYSKFPMPRRIASGMDSKRLELLLAVLQKHVRLPLETMDVFVNVAGGIRVTDPGIDSGVCLAVFSSLKNIPLSETVGIAEVGLLGELRNVSMLDKRIREAKKLGFTSIITASSHKFLKDSLARFKI